MFSNNFTIPISVLLLAQIVCSQILFEYNFTNVMEQEIPNFLPQNFVLQENMTIYITLSLIDENNYATLQVCRQQICVQDQNSIDFKHNSQYIKIEHDYDFENGYNGLSYFQDDYEIKIKSQNNPSTYEIKVEVSSNQICYQPCQNNKTCVKGMCQCNLGYSGFDCSIQLIDIENVQNMTTSQLYYFPYLTYELNYDFLFQLSESSRISYSCNSKLPSLMEYEYVLNLTYLNISLQLMQDCQQYYEKQLESYQNAFSSFIVLRLLNPDKVDLITQYNLSASSLSLLGIVFGCIGGFLLIIVICCIRRCHQDAAKREKKHMEQQQEKELLDQCLPSFDYQSLITKFPGLKEDIECLICLIQFQPLDKVRLTPCTHIFHNQCIETWLEKHKTCPTCREPLEVKHFPNIFLESYPHNQRTKSIHGTEDLLHLNKISHRLLGNNLLNQTPPIEESKQKISEEQPSRIEQSGQEKNESIANHPYK